MLGGEQHTLASSYDSWIHDCLLYFSFLSPQLSLYRTHAHTQQSERARWTGTDLTWGPLYRIRDQDVIKYEYTNIELICKKKWLRDRSLLLLQKNFMEEAEKILQPNMFTMIPGWGRSQAQHENKQKTIFHLCTLSHYITLFLLAFLVVRFSNISQQAIVVCQYMLSH